MQNATISTLAAVMWLLAAGFNNTLLWLALLKCLQSGMWSLMFIFSVYCLWGGFLFLGEHCREIHHPGPSVLPTLPPPFPSSTPTLLNSGSFRFNRLLLVLETWILLLAVCFHCRSHWWWNVSLWRRKFDSEVLHFSSRCVRLVTSELLFMSGL